MDIMTQADSKTIKVWMAWGFAFGSLMAILNWLCFYRLPECPATYAIQTILIIVDYPAQLATLLIVLNRNIYVLSAMIYAMVILQWTACGFLIGYFRILKRNKLATPHPED